MITSFLSGLGSVHNPVDESCIFIIKAPSAFKISKRSSNEFESLEAVQQLLLHSSIKDKEVLKDLWVLDISLLWSSSLTFAQKTEIHFEYVIIMMLTNNQY